MTTEPEQTPDVTPMSATDVDSIRQLFARYGMHLEIVPPESDIPGSFWGAPEAGLIKNTLFVREDTPVHSLLHEGSHFICMTPERREVLHTDAGGDFEEENAVCYLQILLACEIGHYSTELCLNDMDKWGYTFRLGSARAWFEGDAEECKQWLEERSLIPPHTGYT